MHWPRTLAAGRGAPERREQLRFKRRPPAGGLLHLLLVDCSSSMLKGGRLALAKALLQHWQADIYRRRDRLAVVGFDGAGARVVRPPGKALALAEDWLQALGGRGETPVGDAVALGDQLIAQLRLRDGFDGHCALWLLSDGGFAEQPPAPQRADSCTVVDLERGDGGRCQRLAAHWRAEYQHALAYVNARDA